MPLEPKALGLLPFLLLIGLAVWLVRAGRRPRPHDKGNIRGGGPGEDATTISSARRNGWDSGDGGGGGSDD